MSSLEIEEILARETFFSAHSPFIPDDLCLAIPNLPQTFNIISQFSSGNAAEDEDHTREVLPTINDDLLAEVYCLPSPGAIMISVMLGTTPTGHIG